MTYNFSDEFLSSKAFSKIDKIFFITFYNLGCLTILTTIPSEYGSYDSRILRKSSSEAQNTSASNKSLITDVRDFPKLMGANLSTTLSVSVLIRSEIRVVLFILH